MVAEEGESYGVTVKVAVHGEVLETFETVIRQVMSSVG